jgi:DHA1 family bicyclomycin/chloramphenicol resistance-like MFS transporter
MYISQEKKLNTLMKKVYQKILGGLKNLRQNSFTAKLMLALASIQAMLAIVLYLPSMPALVEEGNISTLSTQYAISLFILGQAIIPLFVGYLADRLGIKKIMASTMALFSMSCFLMLVFSTTSGLLLCRFFQGGFSQAGITLGRALVKQSATYHQTVKILSWMAVIQSLVHLSGPFFGGWVIEHFHWSNNFYILGILGIILFFLCSLYFPSGNKSKKTKLTDNVRTLCIKKILFCPYFLGYSFIISTLHFCTIFFFAISPFYFMEFHNTSPEIFGIYLGITSFGFIAGSIILPMYLNRFDHEKILIISLLGALLSGVIVLMFSYQGIYLIEAIVVSQFVYAFGKALVNPILQSKALDLFPRYQATSSSIFNFVSTITASLGSLFASFFVVETTIVILGLLIVFTSISDVFLLLFLLRKKQNSY